MGELFIYICTYICTYVYIYTYVHMYICIYKATCNDSFIIWTSLSSTAPTSKPCTIYMFREDFHSHNSVWLLAACIILWWNHARAGTCRLWILVRFGRLPIVPWILFFMHRNFKRYWRRKLMYITYKDVIHTAQRTQCGSIRKANRWMLVRDREAVMMRIRRNERHTLCGTNADCSVECGST